MLASIIEIFGPFPGGPAPLFLRTTNIVGSIGKSDRADEMKVGILFTNSEPSEARQAASMIAHHGLLSTVARSHLEIVLTAPPRVSGYHSNAHDTFDVRNRKGMLQQGFCFGPFASILECPRHVRFGWQSRKRRLFVVRKQRRHLVPIIWLTGEPAHIHARPTALSMARAPTHGGHGMTAIGRAFSRAIVTLNDNEILKQLALLCAAGLFVSLLMLTYGVDLSPGFF